MGSRLRVECGREWLHETAEKTGATRQVRIADPGGRRDCGRCRAGRGGRLCVRAGRPNATCECARPVQHRRRRQHRPGCGVRPSRNCAAGDVADGQGGHRHASCRQPRPCAPDHRRRSGTRYRNFILGCDRTDRHERAERWFPHCRQRWRTDSHVAARRPHVVSPGLTGALSRERLGVLPDQARNAADTTAARRRSRGLRTGAGADCNLDHAGQPAGGLVAGVGATSGVASSTDPASRRGRTRPRPWQWSRRRLSRTAVAATTTAPPAAATTTAPPAAAAPSTAGHLRPHPVVLRRAPGHSGQGDR